MAEAGRRAEVTGGDITEEDLQGTPAASPAPPAGAEGILRVARHYRDRRQFQEAQEAYSRLISDFSFSPLLPGAFMERGLIREKMGNYPGALADFDTVAQAFPGSPEARKARQRAQILRNP
jgi:tetratricopeptide (TPR) repeat protein